MENQVKKKPRTRKVVSEKVELTEAGNPVMFVTVEEHNKMLDDKNSQIIKLDNAINAAEKIIKNLDSKINDFSNENRSIRFNITSLNHQIQDLKTKLDTIPRWIKYLFGVK
jgi:peptidoglycan hydrolase CwlO-like protein